jgi:hypothetical protein
MNDNDIIEDLRLLSPSIFWLWLLLILAVALTVGMVYWIQRRRRLHRSKYPVAEALGAKLWDRALADLESLAPLLDLRHSRDYAIRSTAILRHYIEARYGLCAPNQTTEEFLVTAGQSPVLPGQHRASLRRFLELCDLLKFGRYLAPASELAPLHAAAVAFVLASRPVMAAEPTPEGPA